jgi:hypothetical protein
MTKAADRKIAIGVNSDSKLMSFSFSGRINFGAGYPGDVNKYFIT